MVLGDDHYNYRHQSWAIIIVISVGIFSGRSRDHGLCRSISPFRMEVDATADTDTSRHSERRWPPGSGGVFLEDAKRNVKQP